MSISPDNVTDLIKSKVRTVRDWPIANVNYRDVTPHFSHVESFQLLVGWFSDLVHDRRITRVAGIDARGFIVAGAVAHACQLPLSLVRKKGKLPPETLERSYTLEYGSESVEVHLNSAETHDRLLLIDDLIATGGTLMASVNLYHEIGVNEVEVAAIIDLPELQGSKRLEGANIPVNTICAFTEDE